jgi:hypothetical protein
MRISEQQEARKGTVKRRNGEDKVRGKNKEGIRPKGRKSSLCFSPIHSHLSCFPISPFIFYQLPYFCLFSSFVL